MRAAGSALPPPGCPTRVTQSSGVALVHFRGSGRVGIAVLRGSRAMMPCRSVTCMCVCVRAWCQKYLKPIRLNDKAVDWAKFELRSDVSE